MTEQRLRQWLKTMAEIRAELSDDAPPYAFQDNSIFFHERLKNVTLELPPDILEYLQARGVIVGQKGGFYFRYRKDLKIPILPKE